MELYLFFLALFVSQLVTGFLFSSFSFSPQINTRFFFLLRLPRRFLIHFSPEFTSVKFTRKRTRAIKKEREEKEIFFIHPPNRAEYGLSNWNSTTTCLPANHLPCSAALALCAAATSPIRT